MKNEVKGDQIGRVLKIYSKLSDGYVVNKAEEAELYGVNERSIQRDVDHIRNFLVEEVERTGIVNTIVYDRIQKGYRLETLYRIRLQNSEILAICKILLDSRAFTKEEMVAMLDKLITCCVPEVNQKRVKDLIRNEEFHYVEPQHKTKFIELMWDLGQAISESRYIEVDYYRTKDKQTVHRKLQPVAIMFSEYYFYLTAFIPDEEVRKDFDVLNDSFPTIYRIDRIKSLRVLNERFYIPYSNRFEEGEFRKRIQFMYGGKLRKVSFRYTGTDIDAILDRLPTAKIRDKCAVVSKRNISRQESASRAITDTVADTKSHTFSAIVYNYSTSKNTSQSIADTIGSSDTISYDAQNGLALELMKYCDKAIERIKGAINTGLWGVTICYSAKDELHASIIGACLTGELSKPSEDILPSMRFNVRKNKKSLVDFPIIETGKKNDLMAPISSGELGIICMPPIDSAPDFEIREEKIYPMVSSSSGVDGVTIGRVTDGHRPIPSMEFALSESDLNKHTFVCGITGSGKTTTVKGILSKTKKPFMVIESAKKEYRNIKFDDSRNVSVYTIGKPEINCPQFNPFYVQKGISLQTHVDYLKDLFNASFSFYGPMTYILEKCLYNIYINKGWNITFGYHPYLVNTNNPAKVFDAEYMQERYSMQDHKYLFPTMQDLKDEVERYIKNEMDYDGEVSGNIKSAMLARLESLCVGSKGFMFNTSSFLDLDSLMKENAVFELEGLADDSDKAFCVGLFIIFVNEYRQISKEESGNKKVDLQHLLVIDDYGIIGLSQKAA